MNPDLPLPIIKSPEPLAVPLLQSLFSNAGIAFQCCALFWMGNDEGCQRYRLVHLQGENSEMKVISFLSEAEKIIFRAFQDWFAAATRKVSDASRGYYTFDVLQFQIGDAPWSWNDFTALLIAHAKKLIVGERQLIRFGALWGVLHKRTEAEFGRVESKLHLSFCKPSPEALTRFVEKQRAQTKSEIMPLLIFRDLSRTALCPSQAGFELLTSVLRPKDEISGASENFIYWHPASNLCLKAV